MPPERTARCSFPPSHMPTLDASLTLHSGAEPTNVQSFNSGPRTEMPGPPALLANACSGSYFVPRHNPPEGFYPTSGSSLQWNGLSDVDIHQRLTQLDRYENCNPSYERISAAKALETAQWDYELMHDQAFGYHSVACPSSYQPEMALHTKGTMGSRLQVWNPSAFSANSTTQSIHRGTFESRRLESEFPTLTKYEAPTFQLGRQSFENSSSAPSRSPFRGVKLDDYMAVMDEPSSSPRTASKPNNFTGEDTDEDGSRGSEPYAQLIYRALMSAPGHRMVLKDIYEWFEKHTDKAKSSSKGWQNSIRHNLSMNGAFRKVDQVPPTDESKKGFIWVLEPSAIENGVESTTRYRRTQTNKKPGRADPPASQRQRSGAKGGRAAKKAARAKRSGRLEDSRNMRSIEKLHTDPAVTMNLDYENHAVGETDNIQSRSIPYYMSTISTPTLTVESSLPDNSPYTLEDITGCVNHVDNEPLFYEDFDEPNDSVLPSPSFYSSGGNLLNCEMDHVT